MNRHRGASQTVLAAPGKPAYVGVILAGICIACILVGQILFLQPERVRKYPPTTTVWMAPIASWSNGKLTYEMEVQILRLLSETNIDVCWIGGHGTRIWVPYERYEQARKILLGPPFYGKVPVFTVLAGPRPDALSKHDWYSSEPAWAMVAAYDTKALAAGEIQKALNAEGIECGIIAYPWATTAGIYTPTPQAARANAILRSNPLGPRMLKMW